MAFPSHPPEVRNQAIELFNDGGTYHHIAKRLRVDKSTIRRWLRGYARTPLAASASEVPGPGAPTAKPKDDARAERRRRFTPHPANTRLMAEKLGREGLSVTEVAKRLGVDRKTVIRWAGGLTQSPVTGTPPAARDCLIVTTARGTRIEGLSAEAALEIVVMLEVG